MGGSEFDFILLVASIHLALSGSRLLSLDQLLFKSKREKLFQHKKEGVQMTGIHQDTAIGYVKLTIKNMERSLGFYRNVIGLQVISQTDRSARLSADGKRVLLVLEENPSAVVLPERSVTGLYHFAILLPDRKELGIALARLIENGIALGQGITRSVRLFTCLIRTATVLKYTPIVPAARGSAMQRAIMSCKRRPSMWTGF